MIKRFPCQIVIICILGILAVKGFFMGNDVNGTDAVRLQQEYDITDGGILQRDIHTAAYGTFIAAAAVVSAAASAGVWIHREKTGNRKLARAVCLLLAFAAGAVKMYGVSGGIKQQLAGVTDGGQVTVQGRIVKKQYKKLEADDQLPLSAALGVPLYGTGWYVTCARSGSAADLLPEKVSAVEFLSKSFKGCVSASDNCAAGVQPAVQKNLTACGRKSQLNDGYKYPYIQTACQRKSQLNDGYKYPFVQKSIRFMEILPIKNQPLTDHTKKHEKTDTDEESVSVQESKLQWTVYLTDCYMKTSREPRPLGNVILYLRDVKPVIGNTITVSGKVKLFDGARNEGNFDECSYYQNQGYTLKIYADADSYHVAEASEDTVRESLYHIQQQLLHVYESSMPEEAAGVLGAMLTGEKSLLLNETKELYRRSGIGHILAISGLHISILGMAVYNLLRKWGISFFPAGCVSISLISLFSCMTGMGISTMRAVIMFGIYLGAAWCGRAYDSVNGLALAAAFLLFQNPRALFLAGFQFSFAAVAGVLFGKKLCGIFRPKYKLTETVYISFGIQMFTLPLGAWYYFEIPVYSVLLNMLVLPFMELVLMAGLAGGGMGILAGGAAVSVLDGVNAAGWLLGKLSQGMLYVCTLLLGYFSNIGSLFLQIPGAVYVIGRPRAWRIAGYFLLFAMGIWRILYFDLKIAEEGINSRQKMNRKDNC